MKKKELSKRNWDYVLYEIDDNMVLTVVFFDQIDYPRSFEFKKNEIDISSDNLVKLSEEIRENYENFKKREIHSLAQASSLCVA